LNLLVGVKNVLSTPAFWNYLPTNVYIIQPAYNRLLKIDYFTSSGKPYSLDPHVQN